MSQILVKIKAYFYLVEFLVTIAFIIVLMYLFPKHNHKIRQKWAAFQLKFLGIKIEEVGEIDPDTQLFMINHQSLLDIVILEYLHTKNIAWVAKKEIEKLPFFGHIIKAPKMISVNREDKAGLIKLIKDVDDRLSQGRPIAIFPEGTRSCGKKMLPFKSGAKVVANKFDLKVQPVVIIGSKDRLDSVKLKATSGVIKVIYLPAFKASKDSDWFKDVELKMNEVFVKGSL
ncbi:lysophospholipid acyltransferase family protein [Arcobacter sp. FWKO B]|uniref:lysophospholipid acyltransferase family protein n=1 Tax=Arcobacter sp. FWKO B TaxID=2593672 RepID=UPI0018A524E9|nr:lysophospholipid acyltransferase family protein [Arcobacter sp. FWKO B]QOG12916.1 1-acyl-sn-glycerol-3-phosphate acyltransferase [Arcobacter sp. FWKO B]